jgi:Ca2+/Na+ antiporter
MNIKQIIYLIFPFIVGYIAMQIMKIQDTSYWFYVWLLCLLSVFIFVKIILPYNEKKFDAVSNIDYESALKDKNQNEKPYTYIVFIHMVIFVGLIVLYFTN